MFPDDSLRVKFIQPHFKSNADHVLKLDGSNDSSKRYAERKEIFHPIEVYKSNTCVDRSSERGGKNHGPLEFEET